MTLIEMALLQDLILVTKKQTCHKSSQQIRKTKTITVTVRWSWKQTIRFGFFEVKFIPWTTNVFCPYYKSALEQDVELNLGW